jgi:catechol 2,3-dioxygenase-like lactoylglutathione lyase family enzyme
MTTLDELTWMLNTPPRAERVRPGDVVYASLQVPDVERAAVFFGAVLGWSFVAGSGPQGRQVQTAITPRHGLWGEPEHPTLLLCHAVDDLAAEVTSEARRAPARRPGRRASAIPVLHPPGRRRVGPAVQSPC